MSLFMLAWVGFSVTCSWRYPNIILLCAGISGRHKAILIYYDRRKEQRHCLEQTPTPDSHGQSPTLYCPRFSGFIQIPRETENQESWTSYTIKGQTRAGNILNLIQTLPHIFLWNFPCPSQVLKSGSVIEFRRNTRRERSCVYRTFWVQTT